MKMFNSGNVVIAKHTDVLCYQQFTPFKWISYHVYIHISAKPSLLRTFGEQERRRTLDNEWVEVSFLKQTRRQHMECC